MMFTISLLWFYKKTGRIYYSNIVDILIDKILGAIPRIWMSVAFTSTHNSPAKSYSSITVYSHWRGHSKHCHGLCLYHRLPCVPRSPSHTHHACPDVILRHDTHRSHPESLQPGYERGRLSSTYDYDRSLPRGHQSRDDHHRHHLHHPCLLGRHHTTRHCILLPAGVLEFHGWKFE